MSKRSRKLIRSATPTPTPAPPAPPIRSPEPARELWFLPDAEPDDVGERDLHSLIKQWRRGRATRSIMDAVQDAYVAVFTVVMIGAMITNLVLQAQSSVASCVAANCVSARTLVPWATWFAVLGLAFGVARLFGPVLVSAAEGFWVLDAPIARTLLLGRRLRVAVLVTGLVGAVLATLTAALSGSGPVEVALWALADGLGAAGCTALAAAEQTRQRHRATRAGQSVLAALALGTLIATVAVAAGWLPLAVPSAVVDYGPAAAASAGLVLLVASLISAGRRLNLIRRARMISGGSLVAGMQGAMYALDFGLIRDILVERAAVERGWVKPAPGRGLGQAALYWRELQRLGRFPRPLLGLAASVVAPYALDALGLRVVNPFVSGLVLVIALVPFMSTLRVLSRSSGLARLFPFSAAQLRTIAMVVPLGLALVWQALTIPAFVGVTSAGAERDLLAAALLALVTGLAGWLGAVRWVTAKKVDFGAPMVSTEAGAMPPTLIFNLFRGLDMVALITAPVMLGGSPMWSFGLAAVVFLILRGSFNMEEMKAEREAIERERVAEKTRPGSKIRVSRPGR